jgi:hypothetical protein
MSYLSSPSTKTTFGLVVVGDNINVSNGVISIEQSVAPTANIIFNNINANNISANSITLNGANVITSVLPSNGYAIGISNVVSTGANASFTVTNLGVTSLTAGQGISISNTTGDITISSSGADFINVTGVAANYTATANDEYIGVNSASLVTVTLPTGISGRVYTVKDEFGPGFGTISVVGTGGQLLDKANNYLISIPFQSISTVFRNNSWHII